MILPADMLALLFNEARDLLGEVMLARGAFAHVRLTPQGDREIGATCESWQTLGIPTRREIMRTKADGTRDIVLYYERVQPRAAAFQDALASWGEEHRVMVIALPDACLEVWQALARLPLEPQERFAFLLALRRAPASLLGEWKNAVADAEQRLKQENGTRPQMADLKKRMSGHLARPFQTSGTKK